MRTSVLTAFATFTSKFEGALSWMYLDVLGLVTTGRGNLIDSTGAACALPWIKKDGTRASLSEISDEWRRIKSLQSIRNRGGWAFAHFCNLRLTQQSIDDLTNTKRDQMWHQLLARPEFADAEDWPADGQLGLLSMAWAMGVARFNQFPRFCAAAADGDWAGVVAECKMDETGNPGLPPRNIANKILFANAGKATDPDTLYYPVILP